MKEGLKDENDPTGKMNLALSFDRELLLADDKIRKKLGMEIKRYNKKFPVKPLMLEIQIPLKIISDCIFKIEQNYYSEQADILMSYHNENKFGKITCYGKVHNEGIGKGRFQTELLAIDIVNELKKRISNIDKS